MRNLASVAAALVACVLVMGVYLDSGLTMATAVPVGVVAGIVGGVIGFVLAHFLGCVPRSG